MPELAPRDPRLQGLEVLVVGLGRSGLAAARLAAGRGARIVANDARTESELGPIAAQLRELGATLRLGGHPASLAATADLVIVSPGVPPAVPALVAARERGVPVWGEIELAFRYCRGRVIAITGTNGKSTTTAMTGAILRSAGVPGGTGGNLGTPFAELLSSDGPRAVHAVELSSFQLETIATFRASVAAVLNLTPDHQDRYDSLDAYATAKARLLETQSPEDAALLNADDPEHARFLPFARARVFRVSTRGPVALGAFADAGALRLRTDWGDEFLMDAAALPVPGEHNVANALFAALACRLAGCAPGAIAAALRDYRALAHRLEKVGELRGVACYNDSKATNLDAAERALAAFPDATVHAILGGKDKGANWASIADLLRRKARRVLLVGAAAPVIRAALQDVVPLVDCGTVSQAVRAGLEGAAPGDVILLAPGCASYDQYRNFEERGEDFRRAVGALAREEDGNA
jgi:UDP-N-acetylmuramoylalanine--D-glutamate ligase